MERDLKESAVSLLAKKLIVLEKFIQFATLNHFKRQLALRLLRQFCCL